MGMYFLTQNEDKNGDFRGVSPLFMYSSVLYAKMKKIEHLGGIKHGRFEFIEPTAT